MTGSPGEVPSQDAETLRVLYAVRAFSDAMERMYSGMKGDMDMNATDLAALRMLIIREQRDQAVSPHDIARHLRISTASTTKLIDRLAETGHVVRQPHPRDGRARLIALTEKSRSEFRLHFRDSVGAMRGVAEEFSASDLAIVSGFLERLSAAIDPDL
ncbi:MarR family transcriptional regulator [Microbacterium sp. cx-55]|uniref:MarR family winged helix-turn-helix transcriptional regulator n=1 Tax=Microbacterium sp. cx-55 TaxID=2875948 RepID=UPI001CBEC905|nr:MarR family transcriptional regulator [Microbacterium sp. cx-55]MBZ4485934.1 MarR family transcriptional regulator [Microbacterium sp. cx-55]UGB34191.1 MarR family transcriptional regulator [Microbacterium sp. cx-55]